MALRAERRRLENELLHLDNEKKKIDLLKEKMSTLQSIDAFDSRTKTAIVENLTHDISKEFNKLLRRFAREDKAVKVVRAKHIKKKYASKIIKKKH